MDSGGLVMSERIFAEGCAWIEGEYVPISEARIPILDTGFTRSDVTYDVVAVWKGKFFRLNDHLDRFEKSWTRLRMDPKLSREEMREILFECVRRSGLRDAYVEMIVSRGIAPPGVRDPRRFENRFYAYAIPYIWIVKPQDQEVGTHLVIAQDTIRIPQRAIDPTVKNFHWGDLTRGLFEAFSRGGYTAVLLDMDGHVTEGPGFNLFAYHRGVLLTPAGGVLEGMTRRTVLELAEEQGIPVMLEWFGADVLRDAYEIFITSTAGGVMPVTALDGRPVGDGKPGKITTVLRKRYWEAHDENHWAEPVDYPVSPLPQGEGVS
jgi:branched-chain amino acid aminotransferase